MISLRARLALSLLLGSAVLFGAGSWVLDRTVGRALADREDDKLVSRAWALANALQADDGRIEIEALHGLGGAIDATERALYFQVWREDGSLAGRSPSLGGADLPHITATPGHPVLVDVATLPNGRAGRAAGVVIELFEEHEEEPASESTLDDPQRRPETRTPIDHLTVVVAEDTRDLAQSMHDLRTILIFFASTSFALSSAWLWWSVSRGLRPLDDLAARVHRIDTGPRGGGFGSDPLPAELVPIREKLNELLERVRAAFVKEQEFTTALAHELRTPVAELRLMSEVSLRKDDSGDSRLVLRDVLIVATRMQSLVESLLALRRAEAGAAPIAWDVIAIDDVVTDIVSEQHAAASLRQIHCVQHVDEPPRVVANESLLRSIVENILRNAIEYAPARSRVDIAVESTADELTLTVSNQVDGFVDSDCQAMFEPFWRKENAQGHGSHAGIGLTLARALARALGCTLSAELLPEDRLVVRLSGLQIAPD